MPVELPPKNSLSAYDLRGGKRLWQLAEIQPLGPSSTTEHGDRDVDFLGPPLACGGTLYVLGRTNDGANLLAPRSGRRDRPLGEEPGRILRLRGRRRLLVWAGLCPGGKGRIADLPDVRGDRDRPRLGDAHMPLGLPRQPTEEPSRLPPRWGRRFPAVEARWLNAWRESVIRLDDRRCFFVSPRSAAIHALAINSGKVLWTQPVANGLFLGPIVDGRLLAVSQYRAFAFDAATGVSCGARQSAFPAAAASQPRDVICFLSRRADWRPSMCAPEPSTSPSPIK